MPIIADTLTCDTAQLAALQRNPAYDYNRELVAQQSTLWDWLREQFGEWLNKLLGSNVSTGMRDTILMVIGLVVIGLIVWFLYKYRPELFMRNRKVVEADDEEVETIYGIDFNTEISRAVGLGDYRQAARYLYLKTLRRLSDAGHIDWQPSKTPTQYIYEVRQEPFRQLTQHFLRVRYGNFPATQQIFEEMQQLSKTVMAGGPGISGIPGYSGNSGLSGNSGNSGSSETPSEKGGAA